MLKNDTIFVVFDMHLVSHALCYTKIVTDLQFSPKVLETPMHLSFPLQCFEMLRCDYNVTWPQQHCKREEEGKQREQNFPKCFEVFV